MSAGKALQFLDKRDLECAICLERFTEPKTLNCHHNYCLHCLLSLMQTHGKIQCPKCCQDHDLKGMDLTNLSSNKMINYLLEYVEKIESGKPSKCSTCDNQPEYNCSECQLYLCGQCVKHHKIIPSLKVHSLYTLDKNEEEESKDGQHQCSTHGGKIRSLYCSICSKSACEDCKFIFQCLLKEHIVIPMANAVNEFNQNATKLMELGEDIKTKLKGTLDGINKDRSDFESQLKLCRTAIEIKEKTIIKKVQEESRELMEDLEKIFTNKDKAVNSKVKSIDSMLTQLNEVLISINTLMNKPEEAEIFIKHKKTMNAIGEEVKSVPHFIDSFKNVNVIPNFIPSTLLNKAVNTEVIGKITNANNVHTVAKDDTSITVTKGQPFVVTVLSREEDQPTAILGSPSGEEFATEVECDHGHGKNKIRSRCNEEGDWQMKITAGCAHINGSPVNIKVEAAGLVHTISNIADFNEHNKTGRVVDVGLYTDGCLLVSNFSDELLKFNQSGSFVGRIKVPQNVNRMHLMDDGHMVYSDDYEMCVILCNETFQLVRTFGKGAFNDPNGLTVNSKTRIMYVTDWTHKVFKFNIDNGKMLGKIVLEGSETSKAEDVTVTKDGHVIIADRGNGRIQMFDANGKFMKLLVSSGEDDGKIEGPNAVITDTDDNIIVSSSHKLQLFDKNGVFIKRIDHEGDGLNIPAGMCIISNRPRRVAVANHNTNNVKIFNY